VVVFFGVVPDALVGSFYVNADCLTGSGFPDLSAVCSTVRTDWVSFRTYATLGTTSENVFRFAAAK